MRNWMAMETGAVRVGFNRSITKSIHSKLTSPDDWLQIAGSCVSTNFATPAFFPQLTWHSCVHESMNMFVNTLGWLYLVVLLM